MRLFVVAINAPGNCSIISVDIRLHANDACVLGALMLEMDGLQHVATMAAPRHPLRSYIVGLFRQGDLVSVHEATLICDASRQAITKWLKAEGIDVGVRRLAHIAKRRTAAQRILDGLPPARRPTKAQMRSDLEKAVRKFNEANSLARQP